MKRASRAELLLYLRIVLPTLFAILAIASISYGVYLISHPCGFIVGGFLVILAVLDSRR